MKMPVDEGAYLLWTWKRCIPWVVGKLPVLLHAGSPARYAGEPAVY